MSEWARRDQWSVSSTHDEKKLNVSRVLMCFFWVLSSWFFREVCKFLSKVDTRNRQTSVIRGTEFMSRAQSPVVSGDSRNSSDGLIPAVFISSLTFSTWKTNNENFNNRLSFLWKLNTKMFEKYTRKIFFIISCIIPHFL